MWCAAGGIKVADPSPTDFARAERLAWAGRVQRVRLCRCSCAEHEQARLRQRLRLQGGRCPRAVAASPLTEAPLTGPAPPDSPPPAYRAPALATASSLSPLSPRGPAVTPTGPTRAFSLGGAGVAPPPPSPRRQWWCVAPPARRPPSAAPGVSPSRSFFPPATDPAAGRADAAPWSRQLQRAPQAAAPHPRPQLRGAAHHAQRLVPEQHRALRRRGQARRPGARPVLAGGGRRGSAPARVGGGVPVGDEEGRGGPRRRPRARHLRGDSARAPLLLLPDPQRAQSFGAEQAVPQRCRAGRVSREQHVRCVRPRPMGQAPQALRAAGGVARCAGRRARGGGCHPQCVPACHSPTDPPACSPVPLSPCLSVSVCVTQVRASTAARRTPARAAAASWPPQAPPPPSRHPLAPTRWLGGRPRHRAPVRCTRAAHPRCS